MSNVLQRLSVPHCRGGVKVSFLLSGIYRLYNRFGSAVYVSQRGMCRRSVLYAIKQTLTTLKPHRFEAFIHNIVTFSLRYNNQNDGLSFTPPRASKPTCRQVVTQGSCAAFGRFLPMLIVQKRHHCDLKLQ